VPGLAIRLHCVGPVSHGWSLLGAALGMCMCGCAGVCVGGWRVIVCVCVCICVSVREISHILVFAIACGPRDS